MAKQINPQGYNYGKDPTNSNPFWSESEIAEKLTASASVDNTTGTPEVSVSTTGYNVDFKFSGLKGERGEKGEQGVPGEKGEQGERGASGKDGRNGYNVTLDSTGSKESGTISTILYGYTMENGEYKSVTSYVYNGKKGERGEKGEPGKQGEQGIPGVAGKDGKDGKDADISSCVTNVSVANGNGKYTIKQTKGTGTGAVESDVGEIAVPDTSNLLAEITDSVTENATDGYDHHVIKETENNGTQNDVGNFYIARKQITELKEDGTFKAVDQNGLKSSGKISLGGGKWNRVTVSDLQNHNYIMARPEQNEEFDIKFGAISGNLIVTGYGFDSGIYKESLSNRSIGRINLNPTNTLNLEFTGGGYILTGNVRFSSVDRFDMNGLVKAFLNEDLFITGIVCFAPFSGYNTVVNLQSYTSTVNNGGYIVTSNGDERIRKNSTIEIYEV